MGSLPSWNDTATREAIVAFAETAAQALPPEERVAVFDNDGTLWCEKPIPIELGFILQRLAEMAERDDSLQGKQPWKAAREHDHGRLGDTITKHYEGDERSSRCSSGASCRRSRAGRWRSTRRRLAYSSTRGGTRRSDARSSNAGMSR